MRYLIHDHPAFPGLLSKEDLFILLERGTLARGDLCTDILTKRDHTVGDVVRGMNPPRGNKARVSRPAYQEIRADQPADFPGVETGAEVDEVVELEAEEEPEIAPEVESEDEESLLDDEAGEETLLLHAHPSWLSYQGSLFFILLMLGCAGYVFMFGLEYALIPLLTALAWFIGVAIARFSTDYIVTEERVERVWGILGRSSKEVRICDIRSIDVYEKGLLGMLGIGSVDISSAGNAGIEVSFQKMRGAHEVKHLVRKLQRVARG